MGKKKPKERMLFSLSRFLSRGLPFFLLPPLIFFAFPFHLLSRTERKRHSSFELSRSRTERLSQKDFFLLDPGFPRALFYLSRALSIDANASTPGDFPGKRANCSV